MPGTADPDPGILIRPVGRVLTPFDEKFSAPRQSALLRHDRSEIVFFPPYDRAEAFDGIDGFSHLWVIFLFDRIPPGEAFRPAVRPPRLGGNERRGVFATRSPFRPGRLGLSAVRLAGVVRKNGRVSLRITGADMVSGTPVVDVKPYVAFADAVPEAASGYAADPPAAGRVTFAPEAARQIARSGVPEFREFLEEILGQDPRPAYRRGSDDGRIYGAALYGYDVKWRATPEGAEVLRLDPGSGGVRGSGR